jgi:hypothetical protein
LKTFAIGQALWWSESVVVVAFLSVIPAGNLLLFLQLPVFRRHPEPSAKDPLMQSAMQMSVARFASKDPLMQSAMQMSVARFASKPPRPLR